MSHLQKHETSISAANIEQVRTKIKLDDTFTVIANPTSYLDPESNFGIVTCG
jgi:hypothetical protein